MQPSCAVPGREDSVTDQELALRQFDELEQRIAALQALAPLDVERLATDSSFAAVVERHLQVATQVAIDLGTWIIADHGWREPRTYADTFYVLGDEGFLDSALANRLAEMARYRNVLVHAYMDVSNEVTARLASEGLADLQALAARFAEEYTSP